MSIDLNARILTRWSSYPQDHKSEAAFNINFTFKERKLDTDVECNAKPKLVPARPSLLYNLETTCPLDLLPC